MKALVKTKPGFGHLELQERDVPEPASDEVKVAVAYAGICGTDIHTYEGHYNVRFPVTLGHEFSGEVVAVGDAVTAFNIGDRVTSETTYDICGACTYCQTGDFNLCASRKGIGTQVDGGFTSYLVAKADHVHHLPQEVSYEAAAMTEPLACAVHAVSKVDIQPGEQVVVMGPGPIGLLVAQVVKSKGAEVIISGLNHDQTRLDKATALGLDHVVNIQQQDLKTYVQDISNGYGADVVLECSGAVPAARQGLDILRKKGRYVQVGIFKDAEIPFDLEKIVQKEIRVVGSRSQKAADWEPALALLQSGAVDAEALITSVLDISQWDEGYRHIKDGEGIKVLLRPLV